MLRRHTPAIRLELRPDGLSLDMPPWLQAGATMAIEPSGQGLAVALQTALATAQVPANAREVQITLAAEFCWLDVVQGDFASMSDRVVEHIARASVAECLGDSANAHELRWQVQGDGCHMVLLAVPQVFLQALQAALLPLGLRAGGINATAVALWNWSATRGRPLNGAWAWARQGQVVMARVRRGVITSMCQEWLTGQASDLDLVLKRLLGRTGDELASEDPRVVLSDDPWSAARLGGWRLLRIAAPAREGVT